MYTEIIIPFASTIDERCQAIIKTLKLPNLTWLLNRSELVTAWESNEFDFYATHERGYFEDDYLTDFVYAVTPCHWDVGIDQITLQNPSDLRLSPEESQVFLEALQPYFAEDGITLIYDTPSQWVASSTSWDELLLASLDRVIGRNVSSWLPPLPQGRSLRRLQNEMQMLLYTHPLNIQREAKGLPSINSFWVSHRLAVKEKDESPRQLFETSLRTSALNGDWIEWEQAWEHLDETVFKDLKEVRRTTNAQISIKLCGERNYHYYSIFYSLIAAQFSRSIFRSPPKVQSILTAL
jgi:hypothetical protein